MTYIDIGLRALLCAVFVVAAAGKLRSASVRAELADAIDTLLPIGHRRAAVAAWLTTLGEAAAVALLLVPGTAALGFGLSALLLAAFTLTLWRGLRGGREVQCRCFGVDGTTVGAGHLARNGALIVAALLGLAAGTSSTATTGGAVLSASGGLLAGWVLTRWDDVAFLLARPDVAAAPARGAS